MKRYFALGLLGVFFLSSCGNGGNESNTTAGDTATDEQSNAASTTDTTGTATANSGAANTTFKEAMDKMMQDMHSVQMTQDPDHDFASMMKMHHQGAIDMANIELSRGANVELKQVAQKTIDDSQKDITELNAFLGSHQPSKKSEFAKRQMDKMMSSQNMNMDHGGDVDAEFAMMMAMHHQQGIDMARDYLKEGTATETKNVANRTIKSNSEDLKKLKAHSGGTGNATNKTNTTTTDHSQHQP